LGGKEKTTLKDLSESLGKETIYLINNSVSKGNSPSYSQNQQKVGKELLSIDEISVMDGGKCILQLRGERPFFSEKFDITKHKNYRYLSDANPKNEFNISMALSTKLKVNPNEEFNYGEYVSEDEEIPQAALDDFEDFPEDLEPV